MAQDSPLGVLAFGGMLPATVMNELKRQQQPHVMIGFSGITDAALERESVLFIPFLKFGRMCRLLRDNKCRDIVFAGQFFRPRLCDMRFDLPMLRLVPLVMQARGAGDDSLLKKVTHVMAKAGFTVKSLKDIVPRLVAPAGVLGRHVPSPAHVADMALALDIVKTVGRFDIGQAVVVDQGRVIAVEGAEGTDGMIARVAALRGTQRYNRAAPSGVLVKAAKPQQQLRDDMPVIGLDTVKAAAAAGLASIGIEAGAVLCAQLEDMVGKANACGIALVGLETVS